MKKTIRIIASCLLICFVSIFFWGCSGQEKSHVSEKEKTYINVNGNELSKNYIGYFFYLAKLSMLSEAGWNEENSSEEAIDTFWKTTEIEGVNASDVARNITIDNVVKYQVQYDRALTEGIELSDKEKSDIDNYIEESISQNGGREAFEKTLSGHGTDLESYKRIFTEEKYIEKLCQKYDSEGKLDIDEEELQNAKNKYAGLISDEEIISKAKIDKFDLLADEWEDDVKIIINDENMKEFEP